MTAENKVELKSCPFCGGEPVFRRNKPEEEYCHVDCVACIFTGPKRATRKTAIEAWNRRAQSPPVAQVEVYRKALEDCIKKLNQLNQCSYGKYCKDEAGVCQFIEKQKALLTSKPEPMAPVRKWKAGEVVGERRCSNPDCHTTLHVFMHNLSPEVQDALNGRKV